MKLKRLILPLLKNKLVFFATHRLHWMREMDFILVLEDGVIVETGTHDELYDKKGAYFQLIQAQEEERSNEAFSNLYHTLFETV